VEDITEALWGTRVSPSTVSNLNKKIYAKIEAWRNRRIRRRAPVSLSGRDCDEAQDNKRFMLRSAPRPAASLALRAVGVALPPTLRQVAEA
jgi:hypothetical protein